MVTTHGARSGSLANFDRDSSRTVHQQEGILCCIIVRTGVLETKDPRSRVHAGGMLRCGTRVAHEHLVGILIFCTVRSRTAICPVDYHKGACTAQWCDEKSDSNDASHQRTCCIFRIRISSHKSLLPAPPGSSYFEGFVLESQSPRYGHASCTTKTDMDSLPEVERGANSRQTGQQSRFAYVITCAFSGETIVSCVKISLL